MDAKQMTKNFERAIRKGTRLRCRHLKKVADSVVYNILSMIDPEAIEEPSGISVEEINWWLEQAGMDMEIQYTGFDIGEFALIAESMLYGYITLLGLDPEKV